MKDISQLNSTVKIVLVLCLSLFTFNKTIAADLAVTFNVSHYQGGNNISCHGATDGMVEAVIVGGSAPYSYSWNTGSFNRVLTGKGAGVYIFTVTDANSQTVSANVELIEPKLLTLNLSPTEYGGYNISAQGANDGEIKTLVQGGTQPYMYAWSTGSTEPGLSEKVAGSYSLTVSDANGCTISSSITLIEPTPLHIVSITSPLHRGFNVSCYEGHNGQIDLNVAGGVPPYKYDWSTGGFDEDISNLQAGEYSVKVTDANEAVVLASITLTQPSAVLKVQLTPQVYANGFNLSCHDCANGSITATGSGGVGPYNYLWPGGQTAATISGLQAIDYKCFITDANGCTSSEAIVLRSPDRDDWSMNGNSNVDPATQFMGTRDNRDFVIKTNNVERIKVSGSGEIRIHGNIRLDSLNSDSVKATYVDQSGNLRLGPGGGGGTQLCYSPVYAFYRKLCPADPNYYFFGSNNGFSKLVIGNPLSTPGSYKLYVTGGILTERLRIADPSTSFWADYVFDENYKLQSLQEVKKYIEGNSHLPNMPTAKDVKENGIDVLEIQGKLLEKIEELTLHLIAQEERIKELEEHQIKNNFSFTK